MLPALPRKQTPTSSARNAARPVPVSPLQAPGELLLWAGRAAKNPCNPCCCDSPGLPSPGHRVHTNTTGRLSPAPGAQGTRQGSPWALGSSLSLQGRQLKALPRLCQDTGTELRAELCPRRSEPTLRPPAPDKHLQRDCSVTGDWLCCKRVVPVLPGSFGCKEPDTMCQGSQSCS